MRELNKIRLDKDSIELRNPDLLGKTHGATSREGVHKIAVTVDAERFFADYFAVLERQNS